MNKRYTLAFLILMMSQVLFAQVKVDSLYKIYENKIGLGRQSVAHQLLEYFVQQNYYEYPINTQKKYSRAHTNMLVNLGMSKSVYGSSNLDKVEAYARKALASVDEDSLLWKVACQEALAEVYMRKGRLGDALKLVRSNYEIGKKINDDAIIAYTLSTMSGINFSFFKYKEALDYIEEAILIERKNKNTKRLAICLGMKSDILLKLNKIDSSLSCINEALLIDEMAKREGKVAIRLSQKADVLIRLEQWEEAKSICLKARSFFKKSNSVMDEAKTLLQLGTCERNLKHYEAAERYLLFGEQSCQSIGYKTLLWEIQYQLFMLYKDQNLLDKALSYYESSVINRDSVIEEEYMYQLGDYKAKFDMQEKENQLKLSKERNSRKVVVIVLMGVLLLLAVFFVFHNWRLSRIRKARGEELAEMNATKDKIFSVVSHDLKNPVAAQKQILDYFDNQYDQISEQEKKDTVKMLRQSSDSLSDLLLGLLEWASLNSGRMEYHPMRMNLSDAVKSSLRKVSMQAQTKEVSFDNKISQNHIVYADTVMLETVLRNLFTNAVKFSNPGGVVELTAEDKGKEVLISVADKGIGMSEEVISTLFQQRAVSKHGTIGERGTGLGLKMCKSLVETNQGQLIIQSKEGEGSVFSFSVPKSLNENE